MNISIICFTDQGYKKAKELLKEMPEEIDSIERGYGVYKSISPKEWTRLQFQERKCLLYIGATGIAVRMIAEFVESKVWDSPVLVMDERGTFVIPLLSGHLGGANEIALAITRAIGGIPVITTATDVNHTFPVDVFAKQHDLHIQNPEGIAKISSKVLKKEMVDIVISKDLQELDHGILKLKPKEYILGIGCRKGKSYEEIRDFIEETLESLPIGIKDFCLIASIDLKAKEEGILRFARSHQIPFQTYSKEVLNEVSGEFHGSDFVKSQTGVDNVCERAAMAGAGLEGELILGKQAKNGMTLAIGKKQWKLKIDDWEEFKIEKE